MKYISGLLTSNIKLKIRIGIFYFTGKTIKFYYYYYYY